MKVSPSYDGRNSWCVCKDAIDDWCDILQLDNDKRELTLRYHLEREAAIRKGFLNREYLKDQNNDWISRFQLSIQRMQEAWNDIFSKHRPLTI